MREEDLQTLTELELTDLQAKVYLALVQLGDSRATEICRLSKVTRPDIYRVLNELADIGLVEKTLTKPLVFKATPLRNGIHLLLERREKKTIELKTKVKKMVNLVEKQKTTSNWLRDYKFVEIPNRGSTIKEDIALNRVNWQTMDIVTLGGRFIRWICTNKKSIDEVLSKGVKIRIIVSCAQTSQPLIKKCFSYSEELSKNPQVQVKCVFTSAPALISLYDNNAVRMVLKPLPYDCGGIGPDLFSDHPSFVGMARMYFEALWNSADKFQTEEIVNVN